MRNYNYRKSCKKKEQEKRKLVYNTGYFPTMPNKGYGDNGEEYFIEGCKSNYKQYLKKVSNKKVRNYENLSKGSNYKRVFDLPWIWY